MNLDFFIKVFFGIFFSGVVISIPIQPEDGIVRNQSDDEVDNPQTWLERAQYHAEEMGGSHLVGDVLFSNVQFRNGLAAETKRWPNGEIPFKIKGHFEQKELNMIQRAMHIYHKYTCIKFREKTAADRDYISIENDKWGCFVSAMGRVGRNQTVNLDSSCTSEISPVLHELMHAIGFYHEHMRPDRDKFVTIIKGNIKEGHEHNFDKQNEIDTNDFGVPYDYYSIMHYYNTAFSKDGQPTIIPKIPDVKIGVHKGLSHGDIEKINAMYGCPEKTEQVTGYIAPHGGDCSHSQRQHK